MAEFRACESCSIFVVIACKFVVPLLKLAVVESRLENVLFSLCSESAEFRLAVVLRRFALLKLRFLKVVFIFARFSFKIS